MLNFIKKFGLFSIAILLGLYFFGIKKYKLNIFNSKADQYSLKTNQLDNKLWGYSVLQGDRLLIEQNTIPGVSGNAGFANQKEATEIGKLVISKLENGEFPPNVSKKELMEHEIQVNLK